MKDFAWGILSSGNSYCALRTFTKTVTACQVSYVSSQQAKAVTPNGAENPFEFSVQNDAIEKSVVFLSNAFKLYVVSLSRDVFGALNFCYVFVILPTGSASTRFQLESQRTPLYCGSIATHFVFDAYCYAGQDRLLVSHRVCDCYE